MHGKRHPSKKPRQLGPRNGEDEQDESYHSSQYGWKGEGGSGYGWAPRSYLQDLTNSFDGLSTADTSYSHGQAVAPTGYSIGSSTYGHPAETQQANHNSYVGHHDGNMDALQPSHLGTGAAINDGTGKGKGVQGSDPYVTGTGTMSGGDPYGGNHGGSSTALYSMSNSLAPGYTTGSNLSPSDGGEDVHDYDLQRAISESRADRFESVRLGESSNANAHYADSRYGPRYGQASAQTGGYGGMDATPRVAMAQLPSIGEDPSQYTDPLMQLYRVAGHSQAARNYLRPDLSDPADPRFMVYHSSAFIPGHVFKIWWAEPRGQVSPYSRAPTGRETVKNSSGDFHVGYRRFLIISTDESHHSNCVPILTYEGRACCKPGVRPSKHGIIHAEGTKPRLRRGEPQLGFRPVPLRIYAEGETLAAESRVNYSKFRSIEHNLKVFFIGQVPEKYLRVASDAVDRCWADTQKHS